MPRRKVPYKEGDFFAVPLRTSGYGIGLVARTVKVGGILGYFFPGKYQTVPTLSEVQDKKPHDAFWIRHFGDLGFFNGDWHVIGPIPSWDRADWPVPSFVRTDCISGNHYRITYSEHDLDQEIECSLIEKTEAELLPEDGISGYGALEIRLSNLLDT